MPVSVRHATPDDLDALAPLFDGYRMFYGQPPDRELARQFLQQRLQRAESVVLLAERGATAAGFVQLYPMFSSVHAAPTWVLNDLFVATDARGQGVGRTLLDAAAAFGRERGAIRLELETAPDNRAAQQLYLSAGWQPHDETSRFHLPLASVRT